MTKEAIDITPADSAVPVYLEELTDVEISQRQIEATQQQEDKASKEATRTSALAKLVALGLTEEEINSIIGGIQ